MANPLISGGELQFSSGFRKFIVIALVATATAALLYRTAPYFIAAWIAGEFVPNPAVFERANRFDPDNVLCATSDKHCYHFLLAQIYNSSTEHLNLDRAGEEFKAAVRLNPNRSVHWQELAKWHEEQQQMDEARSAMRKAIETDPNYAKTRWSAANLFLRAGDMKEADFELRSAADQDAPGFLTQVLDLVWRFYEDPDRIVPAHVPNTKQANLIALNFFVSKKVERGAELVWTRLKAFDTLPAERFAYIDFLNSVGKPGKAREVFSEPKPAVAFYNSSFETEPLQGGFDWRFVSNPNAEVRRDATVWKDGLYSLSVAFSGKENVDFGGVWHDLVVRKGSTYTLSFWMKTDGISTNEGIFIDVAGQTSEKQTGTNYWRQFKISFTAPSDLVNARVRRVPTDKFDNLLEGKVWIDAFELTPLR